GRNSPKKQPFRTGSEGLPFSQLRVAMVSTYGRLAKCVFS
ncbi:hypothetical protein CDAR_601111, partial [Caerostris darwini]